MVWSSRKVQCVRVGSKCPMKSRTCADVRGAVVLEDMMATQGVRLQGPTEIEEVKAAIIVSMTTTATGDDDGIRDC